jgi:hypothetical protein
MGWTFGPKPHDVRDELLRKLTWDSQTHRTQCVDLAIKRRAAYAAVETVEKSTGQREVWAAVILLRYSRAKDDPYPFGTKELDETCGPRECDCPERILDQLTPTNNEHAREWRLRCRARMERPGVPAPGTRVRFEHAIKFQDGTTVSEFTVEKRGERGRRLRGANGGLYLLARSYWREHEWQVVGAVQRPTTPSAIPVQPQQLGLLESASS